jgi:cytosine/adenosine deaminase-related metal-dependent hydrolase
MSELAIRARWALVGSGPDAAIVADRWVVVEGGRIAAVTADRPSATRVMDRPDLLVLPGLIDLHNHVFTEMLIRGRSEDLDAEQYETTLVYGLLMPFGQQAMKRLSAGELEAVAEFGLMQLVKSGVTTLMEPLRAGLTDPFVRAAKRAGLRFYAAPYLFSTPDLDVGPDGRPSYGGDADAASVTEWRQLHARHDGAEDGRIRVVLSPHGTDTCGPDLMREVRSLANQTGALVTTHLAQSPSEIDIIRERYGKTPPEYLEWTGLLGPDLLVAHCIYATDGDLDILKRTDTTVINCPRSYSRGGVSALFHRFVKRSLRTVIGTDGYNLDLIGELRAAGLVSKLSFGNSRVATAPELVAAVTTQAAVALRRNDIGRIAAGAPADLVAIDLGRPHLLPVSDPLKALVWRASAQDVWATLVAGRLIFDEGRYLPADETAVTAAGRAAVEKVWAASHAG